MSVGHQLRPPQLEREHDRSLLFSMLRRRGVLLLIAAAAGAAIGALVAQLTPPQYMGTARVGLTVSLASADAAEVLSRFRATLVSPEVIKSAVIKVNAADIDPAGVLRRLTSRMAGDQLTVDVIWPDGETAAALAHAIAEAVVADIGQQQERHRRLSGMTLSFKLQQAEVVLRVQREALLNFYQSSRLVASLADIERFTQASNDLSRLSTNIATRRAAIASLQTKLAQKTSEDDDRTLTELMALNEATLGSLAARRDYWASVAGATTDERLSKELAQLSVLEAELIGAYVRALGRRNLLLDDFRSTQQVRHSGLELRGAEATSERVDRITFRSASILGALAGFVVALFGAIVLDARSRRTASAPNLN